MNSVWGFFRSVLRPFVPYHSRETRDREPSVIFILVWNIPGHKTVVQLPNSFSNLRNQSFLDPLLYSKISVSSTFLFRKTSHPGKDSHSGLLIFTSLLGYFYEYFLTSRWQGFLGLYGHLTFLKSRPLRNFCCESKRFTM